MKRRWRLVETFLRAALCSLEMCPSLKPESIKTVSEFLDNNELALAYDRIEHLAREEMAGAWTELHTQGKTVAPFDVRSALRPNLMAARAIMDLGTPA